MDAAAVFFHGGGLDAVFAVFRAVDVHVWLHDFQKGHGHCLVENVHEAHDGDGTEKRGALLLADDGPQGAFVLLDGAVGIQAHHQNVSLLFGLLQKAEVAVVEKVETAVAGHDGLALGAQFFALSAESLPVNDLT